jgi:hypothetical protein
MADADASFPNYIVYAEGESIPPVDPEDIKRMRPRVRIDTNGWSWLQDPQPVLSPGANITAVERRCTMIHPMTICRLLAPWQHGEEFDDAVFRVAATFPVRELKHKYSCTIAGDERFGFDPNAFVQRLIEETGISHVWEPVSTKVSGDKRIFGVDGEEIPGQDPDTLAKRQTRQLLWGIWSRFSNWDDLLPHLDKEQVAALFADFLMNNMDLVRQVEASFRAGTGGGRFDLLTELERRAQGGV